ncbi:hypothetical protein GGR57DRAFT_203183 [Xylariaceae sp. FL1272]|nr:hypothetical protein GGR57DRAFT_203183 [Xylariaceae sp. FL1272]
MSGQPRSRPPSVASIQAFSDSDSDVVLSSSFSSSSSLDGELSRLVINDDTVPSSSPPFLAHDLQQSSFSSQQTQQASQETQATLATQQTQYTDSTTQTTPPRQPSVASQMSSPNSYTISEHQHPAATLIQSSTQSTPRTGRLYRRRSGTLVSAAELRELRRWEAELLAAVLAGIQMGNEERSIPLSTDSIGRWRINSISEPGPTIDDADVET